MKVYLINPKFPVTYWGFEYAADLSGIKYTSPPLGLATVAALTPRGIEVEICDENIEEVNFDTDADLIGLTAYLVQGPRAFQIAAEFQQREKLVVLGGPITSLDPAGCQGTAKQNIPGRNFLQIFRPARIMQNMFKQKPLTCAILQFRASICSN
ncbi:MAG: hypothetical protein RBT80_15780 [Candidatus Vecturithrix sp.]|jgi:radical SAM superfamily enzyme YgiQ (UPF0313 family)|nr:hypothetical protein [Candidatus Vecturithrix sp.]